MASSAPQLASCQRLVIRRIHLPVVQSGSNHPKDSSPQGLTHPKSGPRPTAHLATLLGLANNAGSPAEASHRQSSPAQSADDVCYAIFMPWPTCPAWDPGAKMSSIISEGAGRLLRDKHLVSRHPARNHRMVLHHLNGRSLTHVLNSKATGPGLALRTRALLGLNGMG